MDMNRDELLKWITSGDQKAEASALEKEDNQTVAPSQKDIRNTNREYIQEKLRKPSPAIQTAHESEREDGDEEIAYKNIDGTPKTQVLAYVGCFFSVSIVDILKGKEIKRINLDADTFDLAISPDNRFVYVTSMKLMH
jgi:hypothetical protein